MLSRNEVKVTVIISKRNNTHLTCVIENRKFGNQLSSMTVLPAFDVNSFPHPMRVQRFFSVLHADELFSCTCRFSILSLSCKRCLQCWGLHLQTPQQTILSTCPCSPPVSQIPWHPLSLSSWSLCCVAMLGIFPSFSIPVRSLLGYPSYTAVGAVIWSMAPWRRGGGSAMERCRAWRRLACICVQMRRRSDWYFCRMRNIIFCTATRGASRVWFCCSHGALPLSNCTELSTSRSWTSFPNKCVET